MGTPPRNQEYRCPKCHKVTDFSVSRFRVPERFKKCPKCNYHLAEIYFENAIQKEAAQKEAIRSAGCNLMLAADGMQKGGQVNARFAQQIRQAGKDLNNLP